MVLIGIGQKANDSLANVFDTTGHEDYESQPQNERSTLGKEQVLEEEEESEKQKENMKQDEQVEEVKFMDGKYFIASFCHVNGTFIKSKLVPLSLKNRLAVPSKSIHPPLKNY